MNLGGKCSATVLVSMIGMVPISAQAETKYQVVDSEGQSIEKSLLQSYGIEKKKQDMSKADDESLVQMCAERSDVNFDAKKAVNDLCQGVYDPEATKDLKIAQAKRFKFDLGRDEEGNIRPEGNVALYWSKRFYTELGLAYTRQTAAGEVEIEGIDTSKKATHYDESRYKLRALGYEYQFNDDETFSLGFEYERTERKSNEFGYFNLVLPSQNIDDLIAFDNNVDLTVDRMAVSADMFINLGAHFTMKLDGSYFVYNRLKVDQTIDLAKVSQQGQAKSTTKQDDAYKLEFDMRYMLSNGYGIGFNHASTFTSFKYDAAVINGTFTQFNTKTVETEDRVSHSQVRLFLGDFLGSMVASINYSLIKTDTEDLVGNTKIKDDYNVISIGLNGKF